MIKSIDESKYTGAVFLDLAKALDTVDHSILHTKLSYYDFAMQLFVRLSAQSICFVVLIDIDCTLVKI